MIKPLVLASTLALSGAAFAATVACGGAVSFGEGAGKVASAVADRAVDGVCLNAQIIDTVAEGARYASHGEFISALTRQIDAWRAAGVISAREAGALTSAAARSNAGRTLGLRVIAFNDFHGNIDGANLSLRSDVDGIYRTTSTGARLAVPAGGVDYMAGLVRRLRDEAAHSVVVSVGGRPDRWQPAQLRALP
jgi:5'-nucleotidase